MSEFRPLSEVLSFSNRKFNRAFWIWAIVTLVSFPIVMTSAALLPIFYLLLTAGLVVSDRKFPLIFLYIISLPTNGLIPREDFLVGGIGIQQVLALGALVAVLRIRVSNGIDVFKEIAYKLLILLLVYLVYTSFKNALFDMHGTHWVDAVKRLVNVTILYAPVLLLIRKMGNPIIAEWSQIAVFLGVVNMAIFCFVSPFLPDFGFYSLGTEMVGFARDADEYNRFTGVIGDGDSNTLGAFFVIACGFYLARPISLRRSFIIKAVVILSAIGVALTASRTALVSLLFVGVLFFMSAGKTKLKAQMLVGVVLLAVAAAPLWETVFERMAESGTEQFDTGSTGNRIGKWLAYLQHFIAHPTTFVYGASSPLFIGFNNRFIVAHNFYIQVIYNAGLFFLAGFAFLYAKLFRFMTKGTAAFRLDLIVFPLLAITFFVSDVGAFIYFIIFLALNRMGKGRPDAVPPTTSGSTDEIS